MVLLYNDDLLLNNEQFNFLCQALAENLSISNLPEASEDVSYLFSFTMFLTPIFDEILEKCPETANEIPDPLDLCTLFYLETLSYDF